MFACTSGTHAAFIFNGTVSYLPVEAWDREGNPMVAGDRGLIHADEFRGLGLFAYLESADVVREALNPAPVTVHTPRPIATATVISGRPALVPAQRAA